MKITKRQLRRIIKEEKVRLLREQAAAPIEADMKELIARLERAQGKAAEISVNMHNVEYGQLAGGREADELRLALQKVWEAFGMDPEDL